MPWFRLEESFHSHPKVLAAGNAAAGLWVRCATWSAEYLTDGHIPLSIVRSMGTRAELAACCRTGLWLQVDDEVVIPDWLEFNPSALEVKERKRITSDLRKKGGQNRVKNAVRNADGTFK